MNGAPLITVEELAGFLRLPIEDIDEDTAESMILGAGGLIRDEVHQALDLVVDDVLVLRSEGGRTVELPELPVFEVSLVRVRRPGKEFVELTAGRDYEAELGLIGVLWRLPSTVAGGGFLPAHEWPRAHEYRGPNGWLEVTCTHGYLIGDDDGSGAPDGIEELPETAKTVTKRVAARGYVNPEAVAQETTGRSTNVQYGDTPGLYLSTKDKRDLDFLRPGGRGGTR